MTVDGTDFRVYEPSPFSSKWFSSKFNGSALRYEVAISIFSGDIVWTSGPHLPGEMNDLTIFREELMGKLDDGERVEADKGYGGEPAYIDTPGDCLGWDEGVSSEMAKGQYALKALLRGRHETINRRFKTWNALGRMFRHDVALHLHVFEAVVVITQLQIQYGAFIWNIGDEYTTRM